MNESIIVMLVSIVVTGLLVMFLNSVAKKTDNMVIRADALHYKTDLFSNAAVLIALVGVHYTGQELIDPILGIAIAIYMIYSAIPIIKEGILMLLDASLPKKDIDKIKYIINTEMEVDNYHNLQTRVSGSNIFISFHAVFNTEILLNDAHTISDRIEARIRKQVGEDKHVHILVHMDPYDDADQNEQEEHW